MANDLLTVEKVLVIGAGAMGEGIAQHFATAQIDVLLMDIDARSLDRAGHQIRVNLSQLAQAGLLTEPPEVVSRRIVPRRVGHLAETAEWASIAGFVMEAVPEDLALKQALFEALDGCGPDLILASNSSTFAVNDMAGRMTTPQRVVGVHFFYPAHIIPLVEVHGGPQTSPDAILAVRRLMVRIGKHPIVIRKVLPGFIVNRMQAAFNREVIHMLEQGVATAEELDMAAKACFGFRLACLGPLEIQDLNGLDVVQNSWRQTRPSLCNDRGPSASIARRVARGELGAKTGKGWYDYHGQSREAVLSQANAKLLRQLALFNTLQDDPPTEADG